MEHTFDPEYGIDDRYNNLMGYGKGDTARLFKFQWDIAHNSKAGEDEFEDAEEVMEKETHYILVNGKKIQIKQNKEIQVNWFKNATPLKIEFLCEGKNGQENLVKENLNWDILKGENSEKEMKNGAKDVSIPINNVGDIKIAICYIGGKCQEKEKYKVKLSVIDYPIVTFNVSKFDKSFCFDKGYTYYLGLGDNGVYDYLNVQKRIADVDTYYESITRGSEFKYMPNLGLIMGNAKNIEMSLGQKYLNAIKNDVTNKIVIDAPNDIRASIVGGDENVSLTTKLSIEATESFTEKRFINILFNNVIIGRLSVYAPQMGTETNLHIVHVTNNSGTPTLRDRQSLQDMLNKKSFNQIYKQWNVIIDPIKISIKDWENNNKSKLEELIDEIPSKGIDDFLKFYITGIYREYKKDPNGDPLSETRHILFVTNTKIKKSNIILEKKGVQPTGGNFGSSPDVSNEKDYTREGARWGNICILFSGCKDDGIVHELGHVLGFGDTFDDEREKKVPYYIEMNKSNNFMDYEENNTRESFYEYQYRRINGN